MEDEGWVIGDQIIANINGVDRKMLISGVFSDYMQMGSSARLSPVINCDKEHYLIIGMRSFILIQIYPMQNY